MDTPLTLLKYVGKALLQLFPGGGLVAEVVIEAVPQAAQLLWDSCNAKTEAGPDPIRLTTLIAAVAAVPPHRLRAAVDQIVREIAGGRTEAERQILATYLMHVQASVRRSLRRDSDPTGTTIPPGLVLRKAGDLVRFLPGRLPRLRPGFQPLGDGDLELVELLGVGGFGEVWKARHRRRSQARPVALKFCLDEEAKRSLPREVELIDRVQAQGSHPGFVQLLHAHLEADPPFLVYEYVEGGDLTGLIQEWHRTRQGPTPREAARVMLRLARIVGHAHRLRPPVAHRDLKPANILVQPKGEGGSQQLKVADFGIGGVVVQRALRNDRKGTTSVSRQRSIGSVGAYTALYAPPQQVRGEAPDPRDDVHALGVIWYQLLKGDLNAGKPGGNVWRKELAGRGMSSGMIALLDSCLEDEADNRPRDANALAARLQDSLHAAEEEVVDVIPVDLLPPAPGKPRKAALLAALLAGGTLLMVLVVLVAFALKPSSGAPGRSTTPGSTEADIPGLLVGTWQNEMGVGMTLGPDGTLSGAISGKARMIGHDTMRVTGSDGQIETLQINQLDQSTLVLGGIRFTRLQRGGR